MFDFLLWDRLLLVAYFVPVFCVGMAGNLWVVLSVCRILNQTRRSSLNLTFRHMALYILSLSVADIAVLCTIPMLLSYFLDGHWHFGLLGCKLFFTVENTNKLLSVAILTVMSFERFLAVSRPGHWFCCRIGRKRAGNVLAVVLVLLCAVLFLCTPMIYYAGLKPLELHYEDGTTEQSGQVLCGSDLPDQVMSFFICYMFVLGCLLPLLFISFCYFFLVQHLRNTKSALLECWPRGQSMFVTACTAKVVRSVLRVVGFHLVCWGPFWLFVLIPIIEYFQLTQVPALFDNELSRYFRMFSSFLPYLNSAGNWVFYAAMNRELRDAVTVIGGNTGAGTRLTSLNSFRQNQQQYRSRGEDLPKSGTEVLLRPLLRQINGRRRCASSESQRQCVSQKRRQLVRMRSDIPTPMGDDIL